MKSLLRMLAGEPVAIVVIVAVGLAALHMQTVPDGGATATLVGALFGAAAVLAGNWINRLRMQRQVVDDLKDRRKKLNTLIAAELVNVAIGLINAKELVDAAVVSAQAGGPVGNAIDLTVYLPRPMPFTDGLGVDLLVLDHEAVDALTTLRSNLALTRAAMDDVTKEGRLGMLRAGTLANSLANDMAVLVEVFGRVAPDRKVQLEGEEAKLVTDMLKQAAKPPADPRRMAA